jgi:hypothetical protein
MCRALMLSALCYRATRPFVSAILFLLISCSAGCQTTVSKMPGVALSGQQLAELTASIQIMRDRGLTSQANHAAALIKLGMWRQATPKDIYITAAEREGDTPYAYTLSPGHKPIAIVLASRFFIEATPTGRAAVMIHEMAHYQAYVATGHSDEYDGYKAEYDTHTKLGLTEQDGLVYFAMLDGTAEYVVPRVPSYKANADLKQFLTN